MVCVLMLTSCYKEIDNWYTETSGTDGRWYVVIDAVDEKGEVVIEDYYNKGRIEIYTYNTANNKSDEMWIDDLNHFWEFKIKAKVDQNSLTFSAIDAQNVTYDCKVTVTDGVVKKKFYTTPGGYLADYIEFYVTFDDDTNPEEYGFSKYKIYGYKYTGFPEDK